jgi:hypothetical protein
MTDDIYSRLAAEFPRSAVSWRAQNIRKDGSSALALAYIDARDVMDRLDEVVGPENWSDSYDVHEHVTICSIAIRTADGWVSKADGAGDTDVEAEKGRLSDALKRAAVKWGIGRYLYGIAAPWVECECDDTGKKDKWDNPVWRWKRWKVDPWSKVKGLAPQRVGLKSSDDADAYAPREAAIPKSDPVETQEEPTVTVPRQDARPVYTAVSQALAKATTLEQLAGAWQRNAPLVKAMPEDWQLNLTDYKNERKAALGG